MEYCKTVVMEKRTWNWRSVEEKHWRCLTLAATVQLYRFHSCVDNSDSNKAAGCQRHGYIHLGESCLHAKMNGKQIQIRGIVMSAVEDISLGLSWLQDREAFLNVDDNELQINADQAASRNNANYTKLFKPHHFTPVAIETGSSWNDLAIEFINYLGKRITAMTQEPQEMQYLFQRMSLALQRGNAVAFQNTISAEH